MRLLLGVDGGNTKTIALVARADGSIVGTGRAGCCDHYGLTTPERAYEEIVTAVRAALDAADASVSDVVAGAFSLAGADWPEDIEVYGHELRTRLRARFPIRVVNDAIGALRGGTVDGIGVAIVCGTGTAIGAYGPTGRLWHVSMWGLPSFRFSVSRAAVEAAVQAELGVTRPTVLQQTVPAAVGFETVEQLLKAMSLPGAERPSLGRASVALLDAAEAGDGVARRAVRQVSQAIADMARTAAFKAALSPPTPVVLAGGLFRHRGDALVRAITEQLPGSELVEARFEPAAGALLLAFDEAGIAADLERLAESLPPAALFTSVD
ncbi:MAG: BadF/BadG/BcrA/BcrD ATPase family protein [Gaiellales bacterium]